MHDSSPLIDYSRHAHCCLFLLLRGYHTYFYLFPIIAFVTAFATVAEVAVVHIVLVMTTATRCGYQYLFVHRLFVARITIAANLFMRPIQLEIGFVVIKVPCFPVACVVANLALRTEAALVDFVIFFFVARPAIRLGILERRREVTLLALYQKVSSKQREG